MTDYLAGLNDRQVEAVLHMDGPLMIIAGAGSGKTKVLTTRIIHLMDKGVDAFNILALTFTNKAAKEMKERVEHILGNGEARNLYIGTFHSVFARILRYEADKIGYPRHFTIYDTDDAKSVVKTVVNELNLDDKHYKPNIVYNRISSAKNALVGPEEYRNDYGIQQEDMRANRPAIAQIYDAYAKRCFKNGAMDFDDLLLKFYELLKNVPESLARYQRKFKYILIDEYQDTNPAQYEIIKLLGAMHENVCVVGDDAQSIYSFRGATIQNILQFQKDYDEVKIVKLEQNYRSTQNILHIANEVIKNNKGQIEKVLFTENAEGEKIKLVRTVTDNEEGKFVADSIQEQKLRNHYSNRDFAILYRTNAQSRAFEEAMRRMGIPYTIYGGISFYQRKEIKDIVAYLRIIVNPRDEEALKRIINYPARGIGKTTIDKLVLYANENNISMWEVMERAAEFGIRTGTKQILDDFIIMIRSFVSMLGKQNAYEVAFHVGRQTNLVKDLFNDKSTEGVQRYENIQELLNSIKEWTESPDTEDGELVDKSLASYLQQITLLTDADEKDPNSDTVKLMTIHAAKGLEFSCVFAAGLEEMLFPNALSINTREELEEERRLFYVVITRAKQRLWITYANTRYRFGQLVQNDPSRFIEEIPEQYLDRSYAGGGSRNQSGSRWGGNSGIDRMKGWGANENEESGYARKQSGTYYNEQPKTKSSGPSYLAPKSPLPKVVEHKPSGDFVASDTSNLQPGQKVEHQKFGFGEVMKLEGAAHNPIATVKFEHNGEKKIMLNYAKLRIIFLIILFFSFTAGNGQAKRSNSAESQVKDSLEILQLGRKAENYFANKDFDRADSLIERQIMVAEESLNPNLVRLAYFGNIAYQSATTTKDRPKNAMGYVKRALEFARSNGLEDFMAMAYANVSAINNSDGKLEEGLRNANQAYTTALNTKNDSAKVVCAIQLGNTYFLRSDIIMAFKAFTNAQNIASNYHSETLLPAVYHALGNLYKRLDNEEKAKPYIHQSLKINKTLENIPGQINDYIFLAKMSNYVAGKEYLQNAVQLADSINNPPLKIEAEKILFFHLLFVEKPPHMLQFLEQNQDLKNVFINTGPDYINWMYAEIFFYGGVPDTAITYFRKAEASFNNGYDLTTRKGFFSEYAACLQAINNTPLAVSYYQKMFDMARTSSDLRGLKSSSFQLRNLYQKQGNFKQAYDYSLQYDNYKDSVDLLSKEREFARLEIENLTRQQEREIEFAKEEERRKHNLQYLFITLCVGVVFLLLIMLGMFTVSTFAIRAMGFFSLIFFFEFMILILDKWIHHLTHGEPWKILLIKIGIVSILLPVHHYVEHRLIHYLLSKHLITLRSRLSLTKLFKKKKAAKPPESKDKAAENVDPT